MSTVGLIILLLIAQVSTSEFPTISFLQKSPSSPIICLATAFYPDTAMLSWTKDGEELYEGVEHGEILPIHNGTFQQSVELDVSSVPLGDWGRYHCVFRFSDDAGKNISIKLDKDEIKFNQHPSSNLPIGLVIGAIVGLLIIAVVFVGVCKYKQHLGRTYTCGLNSEI